MYCRPNAPESGLRQINNEFPALSRSTDATSARGLDRFNTSKKAEAQDQEAFSGS